MKITTDLAAGAACLKAVLEKTFSSSGFAGTACHSASHMKKDYNIYFPTTSINHARALQLRLPPVILFTKDRVATRLVLQVASSERAREREREREREKAEAEADKPGTSPAKLGEMSPASEEA